MNFNSLSSKRFAPEDFKSVKSKRDSFEQDVTSKIKDVESAQVKIAELEAEIKRLQALLEESTIRKSEKPKFSDKKEEEETILNEGGPNV